MREIANTNFGRNSLLIGLISHVAAIIVAMMPSAGSEAFFKIVYPFSWLALILGAYAELKDRGYSPFRNWRFYIITAVTVFPFLGPLIAFWVLYRLQRGREEEKVSVLGLGMFASLMRLRANHLVLFILILILFILFVFTLSQHDPYFKRRNLNMILPQPAFASEKLAPAGSKQGPEIFVQLAKESIIYFSSLKFMQEV